MLVDGHRKTTGTMESIPRSEGCRDERGRVGGVSQAKGGVRRAVSRFQGGETEASKDRIPRAMECHAQRGDGKTKSLTPTEATTDERGASRKESCEVCEESRTLSCNGSRALPKEPRAAQRISTSEVCERSGCLDSEEQSAHCGKKEGGPSVQNDAELAVEMLQFSSRKTEVKEVVRVIRMQCESVSCAHAIKMVAGDVVGKLRLERLARRSYNPAEFIRHDRSRATTKGVSLHEHSTALGNRQHP